MTFADLLYRIWSHIYNNKQSWLGSITAVLAFVQANSTLRNLLTANQYEVTMFVIGVLMVIFARSASGGAVASKILPASIPTVRPPSVGEPPNKEGGFVRPLVLGLLLAVGTIGVASLPGCSANPVAVAETPAQKGYALYGSFVIFEEQAVKVASDPMLPDNIRQAIIRADEAAKPAADKLQEALAQFESIRLELAAGTSTEEQLAIAAANLNRWVTEAAPLINSLIAAVAGAKES